MEKELEFTEATRENIVEPRVLEWVAQLVAHHIREDGIVTLYVQEDGSIMRGNPLHIYIDANDDGIYLDANAALSNVPDNYQLVRPIIKEGRPQMVAWYRGQLWEVEPKEEPDEGETEEA